MNAPASPQPQTVEKFGVTYRVVRRQPTTDYTGRPRELLEATTVTQTLLLRSQEDDKLYWAYEYESGLIGTPSPAPFSES